VGGATQPDANLYTILSLLSLSLVEKILFHQMLAKATAPVPKPHCS
jgi:hypothetical protein